MTTLHGIWLPDAFFLFCLRGGEIVPVSNWMEQLSTEQQMKLMKSGKVGIRTFQVPYWFDQGEYYPSNKPKLMVQQINGLSIAMKEALPFLWQTDEAMLQHSGFLLGDSLHYYQKVAQFALQMLWHANIRPGVKVRKGKRYGYAEADAIWDVDLTKEEVRTFSHTLALAMPAICRAYDPQKTGGSDIMTDPHNIQADFLQNAIQTTIHDWLDMESEELRQQLSKGKGDFSLQWLRGLLTRITEPIEGTTKELQSFKQQVDLWTKGEGRNKRDCVGQYAMRLYLRLEPPQQIEVEAEESIFTLHVYLQPVTEPSRLISAKDIWLGSGEATAFFGKDLGRAQEFLLEQLGCASILMPALEETLRQALVEQIQLPVQEAFHFLQEIAPRLQAEGVGVQLPSWWVKRGRKRLGLKLRVKQDHSLYAADSSAVIHRLGLHEIVRFDAKAALGDQEISLAELEKIADSKLPFIQLRGEWTEVNQESVKRMLQYLKQAEQDEITLHDMLYLMAELEASDEWEDLPVVDFELPTALDDLLHGRLEQNLDHIDTPMGLQGVLRPYQKRGYAWLQLMSKLGFGVCLADDMGLGKTIQMITVLMAEKLSAPAIIVCPTSLMNNWSKEIERFAPTLRVYTHHGPERLHQNELQAKVAEHDVVITSYSLVNRDLADLMEIKWSYLVLDEAQNIKNSKSKQARSAMKIHAQHRIAMTGTPIENRLSELWSIFQFLNPGYLGTLTQFRTQFTLPIERYREQERMESLRKLVKPFILRRLKTDPTIIVDLPEKIESKTYCTLSEEQASLYQAAVNHMMQKINSVEGMQRRGYVLATLTHLKQICDHPALYLHQSADHLERRSGKVRRVTELVHDIMEQQEAVLLFTQYVDMGSMLAKHFREVLQEEVLFLHGGISKQDRDDMIDRFQSGMGPRIFILSLKAGGVGLNLTRANHVIHFDRWWNPAVENQATDRAYRIGQKKNVHVHRLICQGTLEERIDQLMESKRELAEQVIHSGEQWITELSANELHSLFELREDLICQEEDDLL
ncbi:DEAD/DEAH box helicase [Brevibacillus halotolerans]|nr:DEAD/DEAH box helicase [Brevibacillus halotolerans]